MRKVVSRLFVEYPKAFISIFVVLTFACGWFVPDFEVDASADTLLVKNNRLYIESRQMDEQFAPEEFVLVGYRPHDGNIFSEDNLLRVQALTQELATIERVRAVTSLVNVPLLSAASDILGTELDPDQWTWQERRYSEQELREIFTDHPIFTDLLVNRELSATAIQLVFEENEELNQLNSEILVLEGLALDESLSEEQEAQLETLKARAEPVEKQLNQRRNEEIQQIYNMVADYEQDADLFLGGAHVLANHMIEIIQHDLVLFGSSIAIVICLMLLMLFRDWRWLLIPVVCCLVSIIITMGSFGFLGLKTTVISSNFIALQLILTLALTIHLIVQYRQLSSQDAGADHHALLVKTVEKKMRPCFYAGLTTSAGFSSLLFSGIQPVITFGWMMIVAMATSIVVSLVLFPAILALFRQRIPAQPVTISIHIVNFFRYVSSHFRRSIIVASLLLVVFSATGFLRLEVENSFLNYFRESTQIRQELAFIDSEFGGSTPLDVVYHGAEPSADPEISISADTVQTLQRIQGSLRTSEAIGNITSVVNFLELARAINDDQPLTEYELNSLYLLIDENLRQQLLGSYVDLEQNDYRISTRIKDTTEGLNREAMLAAVRSSLIEMDIPEESFTITNVFVLYQDIMQKLYTSQILTLGLVFIALGVILLIIFRSVKVAVIALIPNVLVTIAVLGGMGWAAIPLDLMTMTIAAIAMGIAVDDTIHFVHHYLEDLKENREKAMDMTFNHVGYALFYTSLIITLGFSVLGFSDFLPSVLFGLLTALAMILAFIVDMTLLPVLLQRFVGDSYKR